MNIIKHCFGNFKHIYLSHNSPRKSVISFKYQTFIAMFLAIISLGIFSNVVQCAPSWHVVPQSGIPNSLLLTDIHVINNKLWITSGTAFSVYHSSNSGTNFTAQTTSQPSNGIVMLSETGGYVGGQSGAIHHTVNGGTTWTVGTTFLPSTIRSIDASPDGTIYCVGDSGWVGNVSSSGVSNTSKLVNANLYAVSFPVNGEGWLCGGSIIQHFTGSSWAADQNYPLGGYDGMFALSSNNIWTVGDSGIIIHTVDGNNWNTQRIAGSGNTLNDVNFTNSTVGWAVGMGGTILHTTNGGTTWESQTSGTTSTLTAIFAISATDAWAVGSDSTLLHYTEIVPPTPRANVDKSNIYFGEVAIGTHKDEVITLSNTGTADLIVGTVAQADPVALPFSKEIDNCSGQTLTPSSTCTITTRFTPTTHNDYSDTFDIPTNATPSTLTISLNSGVKPFPWTMFMPACAKPK